MPMHKIKKMLNRIRTHRIFFSLSIPCISNSLLLFHLPYSLFFVLFYVDFANRTKRQFLYRSSLLEAIKCFLNMKSGQYRLGRVCFFQEDLTARARIELSVRFVKKSMRILYIIVQLRLRSPLIVYALLCSAVISFDYV